MTFWVASAVRPFVIAVSPVLVAAAGPARAVTVADAVGDFLPTFDGPLNGDLDVTGIEVELTGPDEVRLVGHHAADIGTTQGSAYVRGVDRGQGQEFLTFPSPSIRQGVTFDAIIALFVDGTGFVVDLLAGTPPASSIHPPSPLTERPSA